MLYKSLEVFWGGFFIIYALLQSESGRHNDCKLYVVHGTAAGIRCEVFFYDFFQSPVKAGFHREWFRRANYQSVYIYVKNYFSPGIFTRFNVKSRWSKNICDICVYGEWIGNVWKSPQAVKHRSFDQLVVRYGCSFIM